MSRRNDKVLDFLREVRGDIFAFCRACNFQPTTQQRRLFKQVQRQHRIGFHNQDSDQWLGRIGVKSGQGPGKTRGSVVAMLWRTIQKRNALGIVTAPTMRQCMQWIDDAKLLIEDAHPLLKRMLRFDSQKITFCGKKEWAIKCATATKPENIQGIHRNNMTICLDEASGIGRPIWEAIKGTVSDPNPLVMAIGNPNTRDCEFFDLFNKNRAEWWLDTWSAIESERVSRANIAKLAREYGEDSDVFRVRVLGEFPHTDPQCVLNLDDVEACFKTSMLGCAEILDVIPHNKAISYDFAAFGGDENVVMRRSGLSIVEWEYFPRGVTDPVEAVRAGFGMQLRANWRDDECWHVPDTTGMGQGLRHQFTEANKQMFDFNFARKSSNPAYGNIVTEAWFNLRELTRRRILHIPDDPQLIKQLTTRQYHLDKKGRIMVESKDEYRKRGGGEQENSPDRADALIMAYYHRIVAQGQTAGRRSGTPKVGRSTGAR